jgi:hypothetical protein
MRRMKSTSLAAIVLVGLLAGCSPAAEPDGQIQEAAAPAPKPPDEQAALAALAAINKAQADYFIRSRRYALTYDELIEALFLQAEPSSDLTGYDIRLRPAADASRYAVIAAPLADSPAARHFFTDQTGVVRAEQGKEAAAGSPEITN